MSKNCIFQGKKRIGYTDNIGWILQKLKSKSMVILFYMTPNNQYNRFIFFIIE